MRKKIRSKTSDLFATAGKLLGIVAIALGTGNSLVDLYIKIHGKTSDPMIAVVTEGQLSGSKVQYLTISFRNPSVDVKSVSDLHIKCGSSKRIGESILNPMNRLAHEHFQTLSFEDGLTELPFTVKAGEAMDVKLAFFVTPGFSISECESLVPSWTDAKYRQQDGDIIRLTPATAGFSRVLYRRP